MAKSLITYHKRTACTGKPPIFRSDLDAATWAVEQGAYETIPEAQRSLAELRQRRPQGTWAFWLSLVGKLLALHKDKAHRSPTRNKETF